MDEEKLTERSEWFFNHPKVHQLKAHGITDENQIHIALNVFIYLIEVQHWFNVNLHPVCDMNAVLISGYRDKEKANLEICLPVSATSSISLERLSKVMDEQIFKNLTSSRRINLAIVGADSKIIFYKMADELVPLNH